jgi:cytochrome c553
VEIPLPWERLLWTGRPVRVGLRLRGERYCLTDFRLIRVRGTAVDELVLHDIVDVRRFESRLDRVLGTSTLVVHPRRNEVAPIELVGIRRGAPLAALLELLSGDPHATTDLDAIHAALAWNPPAADATFRQAGGALAAVMIAMTVLLVLALGRHAAPIAYAANDAIEPNGVKKDRAEIVRFMETDVMPWARHALGPIKGGADRVTCATCHGAQGDSRNWEMPSVAALPLPDVRDRGWEVYNARLDAQMRNAIYGYVAESDNQARAAYMREIVVPGMARLLGRPAYDFTRSYEYNRANHALGCYHCHKVK